MRSDCNVDDSAGQQPVVVVVSPAHRAGGNRRQLLDAARPTSSNGSVNPRASASSSPATARRGPALRPAAADVAPLDRSRESEDAVQVEAAESELRRLGLEDLRVHHHGELARIEAPCADLLSVTSEPLRGEILRAVRSAGFRVVALDLGAPSDPGT